MEFFGMGPLEILLILIVGLIALGPGRLPQIARNLGKGITAFRKATMDLTAEVTKELEELKKEEQQPSRQKERETDKTAAAEHEASDSTR